MKKPRKAPPKAKGWTGANQRRMDEICKLRGMLADDRNALRHDLLRITSVLAGLQREVSVGADLPCRIQAVEVWQRECVKEIKAMVEADYRKRLTAVDGDYAGALELHRKTPGVVVRVNMKEPPPKPPTLWQRVRRWIWKDQT